MDDFIELGRYFWPFDPKEEEEPVSRYLRQYWGKILGWDDVLKVPCTVVFAEGGSGKTAEMIHKAEALKAEGKPSFFCRLSELSDRDLESCLEVGTPEELQAWKDGDQAGYFFLDSVDEAKLQDANAFARALKKFCRTLGDRQQRATIVLSTRPHAWRGSADRALLLQSLNIKPEREETSDSTNDKGRSTTETRTYQFLRLAPLDDEQIAQFASRRGVTDTGAFLEALSQSDALKYASRPADLPGLIDRWLKGKPLGGYSDVVANNIEVKLSEQNESYEGIALDIEKVREGAEALAAAATMTGKSAIMVPDTPVPEELKARSIDPQRVLSDWKPKEIQALLSRAIFDDALYGTVRFHHRSAREYLTARWLAKLLSNRKGRRSVEELIFKEPYGILPKVILPRMKPIAGWLAVFDQIFCDTLAKIDPKVVLEHGDSSALDVSVRGNLLRTFAKQTEKRRYTALEMDIQDVRRLASEGLTSTIRDLLVKYKGHDDLMHLLLRVIYQGKNSGFGDLLLPIAQDDTLDMTTRALAIEAFEVGAPEDRQALKNYIFSMPDPLNRRLVGAFITAFKNDALSIGEISQLLERVELAREFHSDILSVHLEKVPERLDKDSLIGLLQDIVGLLSREPYIQNSTLSTRYAWLLELAGHATKALLKKITDDVYPQALVDALAKLDQVERIQRFMGGEKDVAASIMSANRDLKQILFWQKVEELRRNKPVVDCTFTVFSSSLRLDDKDLDYFIKALSERSLQDDKRVALSALCWISRGSEDKDGLFDKIRAAIAGNIPLEKEFEAWINPTPNPELEKMRRQMEAQTAKSDAENRKAQEQFEKWVEKLKADPALVGNDENAYTDPGFSNAVHLFRQMEDIERKSSSRLSRTDYEALVPQFGTAVAERFRNYLQAAWKSHKPQLRSELAEQTSSIPWIHILGLSGVGMLARSGEDWSKDLSPEEAEIAARYALTEINGPPEWLKDLCRHHPEAVAAVYAKEIPWELRLENSGSYAVSGLRWSGGELAGLLKDTVFKALQTASLRNHRSLEEALQILLRDGNLPEGAGDFIEAQAADSSREDDEIRALWLGALIRLKPERGIEVLEKWMEADEDHAQSRLSRVLVSAFGTRHDPLDGAFSATLTAQQVLRLAKLTYKFIKIEEDISHDEVYSPGLRDHAQEAREMLVNKLQSITGYDTYKALQEFSALQTWPYPKDRMLVLAEARAEADAEASSPLWTEADVSSFAAEAEREPTSQEDLFRIGLSRLDDLKLELEEGDESEAPVWRKVDDEIQLRNIFANRLKANNNGKYTVASEEEKVDSKRTDIRLHNPRVEENLPIELKIAGKWQAQKLLEKLRRQLVDDYMKRATHGIFLVVNCRRQGDLKTWKVNGKAVGFKELIVWLQQEAKQILQDVSGIAGLQVIGIDLTARVPIEPRRAPKATRKKPKAKTALTKPTKRGRKR